MWLFLVPCRAAVLYAGWPPVDGAIAASQDHWETEWSRQDSLYQQHVTTEATEYSWLIKSKYWDGDPEMTQGLMTLKVLWPQRFLGAAGGDDLLWERLHKAVSTDAVYNVSYQVNLKVHTPFQDNFLGTTQHVLGMVNGQTIETGPLQAVAAAFAAGMPAESAISQITTAHPTTRVYRPYPDGACFYKTCTPEMCGGCVIRENVNETYIVHDEFTGWTNDLDVTVRFNADAATVAIGVTVSDVRQVLPEQVYSVAGMTQDRDAAAGSFGLGIGMMYGQMRVRNLRITSDLFPDLTQETPEGTTGGATTAPTTTTRFTGGAAPVSTQEPGETSAAQSDAAAPSDAPENANANEEEEEEAESTVFMTVITVLSVAFGCVMFAAAVVARNRTSPATAECPSGIDHVYSAVSSDSFQLQDIPTQPRNVYSHVSVLESGGDDDSETSEVLYTCPPKPGQTSLPDMPAYHLTSLAREK